MIFGDVVVDVVSIAVAAVVVGTFVDVVVVAVVNVVNGISVVAV